MLTANLTLKDVAGSDVVYNAIGFPTNGADRIDVASTSSDKGTLNIRHTTQGKGISVADRHLIQFTRTRQDTTGSATATVNLTMLVPQSSLVDANDVKDMLRELFDLLSSTGTIALDTTIVEGILRGES